MIKEHEDFIRENYPTKGVKYCADILGLKASTVSGFVYRKKLKLDKDSLYKIYSKNIINIDDYINIQNPEIAYILGLIWADGSVILSNNKSKTPVIKHSCVKYDSEHTNLIFEKLKWRNYESENLKSIVKNKMVVNWISSRELGNYLILNNYRNKEKGTNIFKNFPNFLSHFLRGFFDGDGCFTITKYSKNKYKQSAVYFSSSSNQDWTFITEILDSLNVKYGMRINSDFMGKSSQLYIVDSLSIYNLCFFLYKDSDGIRLERKYEKYKEFLEYKKIYKKNVLYKILNS